MKRNRFYCPHIQDQKAILDASETHHLSHVLRLGSGDRVELFDGKGNLAQAEIESVSKKGAVLSISEIQTYPVLPHRIVLAVSMAKSQRFDFLVEKCTEIGADHIAAVQFERTVKLGKDTSLNRYEKISISAAKQSGRIFLPTLSGPCSFDNTIKYLRNDYPKALWIYGEYEPQFQPVQSVTAEWFASSTDIIAVIGPEGGITETERMILQDMGAMGFCINPHILRIETAAIAFCAVLSAFRL